MFDLVDPAKVLQRALHVIRSAIHAAGGATLGRPTASDQPNRVEMVKTHDLAFS